ncbi:MAG: hypothetical protein A2622_05925 [Bdellovibrionales bacterium RIFCSPHIGHO2_01_FULL_40_29]|nr:MAG: hypothetical protein A2622_05925 [Bdellovibrionales bacterium RIFCSPHIGHO2_01_FULL_40_29]OFZ34991.1 MAG: hypothetical protein A3D17_06275 [Bdellovibrionales bacterium RIFCSPHIGHO2_02_FULL_40_15]
MQAHSGVNNQAPGLLLLRMVIGVGSEIDEIKKWSEISKFIRTSQSLVDRSGLTTMPCRMAISSFAALPSDLKNSKKTYQEICDERAYEILKIQEKLDKPIALLYSGGIDSTMVTVTMLRLLGPEQFKKRVIVYLTEDSISENPNFYYNFLRAHSKLESASLFRTLFNNNFIVVGAEFNDQLHGSLLLSNQIQKYGETIIKKPFSFDFLKNELQQSGMSEDSVEYWMNYFVMTLEKQKQFQIETVYDFYWWLNFVYKWQSVFFRIPLRAMPHLQGNINMETLSTYYHHFFSTPDFQRWSVNNSEYRIKDTWSSYKWHVKDLIYEFTKDDHYRNHKIKVGSLYSLFLQSNSPVALSSEYEFIYKIDYKKYYNPQSSFKI